MEESPRRTDDLLEEMENDPISEFCEVTLLSREEALFYLEGFNWSLDDAINCFLEGNLPPARASVSPLLQEEDAMIADAIKMLTIDKATAEDVSASNPANAAHVEVAEIISGVNPANMTDAEEEELLGELLSMETSTPPANTVDLEGTENISVADPAYASDVEEGEFLGQLSNVITFETTLYIQLANGIETAMKFDSKDRIRDIHDRIDSLRPEEPKNYQLLTVDFPQKELTDLDQTIEEAGIVGMSLIQKYHTGSIQATGTVPSISESTSMANPASAPDVEEGELLGPLLSMETSFLPANTVDLEGAENISVADPVYASDVEEGEFLGQLSNVITFETTLYIQLANGIETAMKFDSKDRIRDIRDRIDSSRPEEPKNYQLLTVDFPQKELTDLDQTIEEAGIVGSSLIQKYHIGSIRAAGTVPGNPEATSMANPASAPDVEEGEFLGHLSSMGTYIFPANTAQMEGTENVSAASFASDSDVEEGEFLGQLSNVSTFETTLYIQLANGTKIAMKFDSKDRIRDIRDCIDSSRPEEPKDYLLFTVDSPQKELTDLDQTIEEAGIAGSSLIQQYRTGSIRVAGTVPSIGKSTSMANPASASDVEGGELFAHLSSTDSPRDVFFQIQLADGTETIMRFNSRERTRDIRNYLDSSRPDGPKDYQLLTKGQFQKELTDLDQTIGHAGIIRSGLIQKYRTGMTQAIGTIPRIGLPIPKPIPTNVSEVGGGEFFDHPSSVDTPRDVTLEIQLADGTETVVRFNSQDRIRDIRDYIDSSRPDEPKDYKLLTKGSFSRVLINLDQTIEQAGIIRSGLIQKYRTRSTQATRTIPSVGLPTSMAIPANVSDVAGSGFSDHLSSADSPRDVFFQIQLADGTETIMRFNSRERIRDIRNYLDSSRPDEPKDYRLLTNGRFQKELTDLDQTIGQAGITRSGLIQIYRTGSTQAIGTIPSIGSPTNVAIPTNVSDVGGGGFSDHLSSTDLPHDVFFKVQLADGTETIVRFNSRERIRDIRNHLDSSRPDEPKDYQLLTKGRFSRELTDLDQTIEQAGITRSGLIQKYRTGSTQRTIPSVGLPSSVAIPATVSDVGGSDNSSHLTTMDSSCDVFFQIQLADGTETVMRFNSRETIRDIRNYIDSSRPNERKDYQLLTKGRFSRELIDLDQTIEQAGVTHSGLIQKYRIGSTQATDTITSAGLPTSVAIHANVPDVGGGEYSGHLSSTSRDVFFQIQLVDGTETLMRFNSRERIRDIRNYIDTSRPGEPKDYQLLTKGQFQRELNDLDQTIEQAGISRSGLIQKYQTGSTQAAGTIPSIGLATPVAFPANVSDVGGGGLFSHLSSTFSPPRDVTFGVQLADGTETIMRFKSQDKIRDIRDYLDSSRPDEPRDYQLFTNGLGLLQRELTDLDQTIEQAGIIRSGLIQKYRTESTRLSGVILSTSESGFMGFGSSDIPILSMPITTIRIVFADESFIGLCMLFDHTIRDIRELIEKARPDVPKDYHLLTTESQPRELINLDQTIKDAGISGSVLNLSMDSPDDVFFQIQLADGTETVMGFNSQARIRDIHNCIDSARPDEPKDYQLLTEGTFSRELTDLDETIEHAGIIGSSLIQKYSTESPEAVGTIPSVGLSTSVAIPANQSDVVGDELFDHLSIIDSPHDVTFSIQLADGTETVMRFNSQKSIRDIRNYLDSSRPDEPKDYQLLTQGRSSRELTDLDQTIEQAGITHSGLIQKYRTAPTRVSGIIMSTSDGYVTPGDPILQMPFIVIGVRFPDQRSIWLAMLFEHTIRDIRELIEKARPEAPKDYRLLTSERRPRELTDLDQTIRDAGIFGSILKLRYD